MLPGEAGFFLQLGGPNDQRQTGGVFSPRAFEPKVFLPLKKEPGQVPRKVEVERRRREFETIPLESVLAELGIDLAKEEAFLPLEAFDDTEFDSRTPEEWASLGVDPETRKNNGVPGRTWDAEAKGWCPCRMLGLDTSMNPPFYKVEMLDMTHRAKTVPRVMLYLLAEDPRQFGARLQNAIESRRRAENLLRFNLCVDNMPTDQISPLSQSQVDSVTKWSFSTKSLAQFQERLDLRECPGCPVV